jgi:hypothetical protein
MIENTTEELFINKCRRMSSYQLLEYINNCLDKISQQRGSKVKIPLNKEMYSKLIALLNQKLSDKVPNFSTKELRERGYKEIRFC